MGGVSLVYGSNVYTTISYRIKRVLYSAKSNAKVKLKKMDADNILPGSFVELVYDKNGANERVLFSGIVVDKNTQGRLVELDISDLETALYYKFIRKRIKPSDVGKTGELDLADVVRYLVDQMAYLTDENGNRLITYTSDSIQDTNQTQLYFNANDYIGKIIDRIASSLGYIWYIKGNVFYFVPSNDTAINRTDIVIDNSIAKFDKWAYNVETICNEVHLFGAEKPQKFVDRIAGDGSTKKFPLSYLPTGDVKVVAYYPPYNGIMDPTKYIVNYGDGTIEFDEAPPNVELAGLTGYEGWKYRQKITWTYVQQVVDPVLLIEINPDETPVELMRGDYKDIRFVDTDNNPIPFVYLGKDSNGILKFLVKRSGVYPANTADSFYMIFGNPSADSWPYSYSDVVYVWDEFDRRRDLDLNKWSVSKANFVGTSCDQSDWEPTTLDVARPVNDSESVYAGFLKLAVGVDGTIPQDYNTIAAKLILTSIVGDDDADRYWIYWDNDPHNIQIVNSKTVSLTATAWISTVCNDHVFDNHYYYNGVYWVPYLIEPTVSFSPYEPLRDYNIEVYYTYNAPIYKVLKDETSIDKYKVVFSKTVVARWINDDGVATSIASKYLAKYSMPNPSGLAKIPIKKYIELGLDLGYIVHVDDNVGNIHDDLLINTVEFENGLAILHFGEARYDISKWADDIDTRVRQLEIKGDENFFIS